ncbi:hypothetical protein SAMN05216360_104340 [Methylobacterium phyllostachyos]|uniref:Uncharacterized protein n=1 Tax=Methylobacterium phyllostachyos TaxID=582672 RepID=A0A1G9XCH0_9HYPH|nr:hypothetical protein [Methylobacterium phyllostachyos]SDM94489.1 hypothetical protein SAMN05216360_104340 [Methylobacterium phyllostachyos]
MPDLVEMELYCLEARGLIARAEDAVQQLGANGACEGHRLMAAQGLTAIRHLNRIIELHRNRLAFAALPNAVSPPTPPRRTWLALLRQRLTSGDPVLETRV